jgi:molybdopterin converting factor small subunit
MYPSSAEQPFQTVTGRRDERIDMDVAVQCYGNVRDVVAPGRIELTIAETATVSDVLDRLTEEYSEFERLLTEEDSLVIMRDGRHVDPSTEMVDGDLLNITASVVRD